MKQDRKQEKHIAEHAHDMKIAKLRLGLWIIGGIFLFVLAVAAFAVSLADGVKANLPERTAEIVVNGSAPVEDHAEFFGIPDEPAEGVGREVVSETYTPAAATISADVLDYTSGVIWGWDGRYCELWEMDLLSRIFYLEFWGASPECCEAGVDAILRLWESQEFGNSLGGVLTAVNAAGKYVYSTYPAVWTTEYDAEGLAWCRAYCEERFATGPVWIATYFQKYSYPDWGVWSPVPCYCLDGVFFSVARWW